MSVETSERVDKFLSETIADVKEMFFIAQDSKGIGVKLALQAAIQSYADFLSASKISKVDDPVLKAFFASVDSCLTMIKGVALKREDCEALFFPELERADRHRKDFVEKVKELAG